MTTTAMNLLPYDRFSFDFAESPAETAARLRSFVSPPQWFGWPWSGNTFTGFVDGFTFRIWLNNGTNTRHGAAIFRGEIAEHTSGSRLTASARPSGLMIVLACFWLPLSTSAVALMLPEAVAGRMSPANLFLPTLLVAGFCGIVYGSFRIAVNRAKPQLEACLRFRPTLIPTGAESVN